MSRSWDTLAAEYTPDAVRMPPNQPSVVGRQAIRQWLEQLPPITHFAFHLVDLQGSGDLAYLRGSWSITAAPTGIAPVSDSGKILVVLQRQPDGTWLRVVDAWNSDAAPGH
jgi:ketosteroid isomerase-like protein